MKLRNRAQVYCFQLLLEWFEMPDCRDLQIDIANNNSVGDMQLMCLQVLLYLIRLADVCGIDLANAV